VAANKINKFPYGNHRLENKNNGERKVASCRVCSRFPYSNLGCCTAPETGWRVTYESRRCQAP